ncbi:hypothetical protein BU23DRAFT_557798 [Bimuria novae-zelandiae CBS 107.79]|uniref:Uncharacterized protein n=1 Tax=Bimuria novae-zelandiae CBS 107.79 TaxID=1447943 RepID=A0A6A5UY03_9PLEO|nr:hypothetical protein BU23DRAFT_557798 [Bimuria novae-zelandiae CBS 107.79]
MPTDTYNFLATGQLCEQSAQEEPARHWFTRHLLNQTPQKDEEGGELVKMIRKMSTHRPKTAATTQRPSTAPSSGQAANDKSVPPVPMIPLRFQHFPVRAEPKASPRPPRPNPDILLDVNAWLDASKPSSPLMGGLSYWREGDPANTKDEVKVQYAIPIVQQPDCERPTTSRSQQLKSFCRQAKKQVRIPTIRRVKSRYTVEEAVQERSESAPVLTVPYDQTESGHTPLLYTRMGEVLPSTAAAIIPAVFVAKAACDLPMRRDSPSSIQLRELEREMEQLVLGQGPLSDRTVRPGVLSARHLPREDSMGSFGSSAPTYFSGMPPPSYKSRPASSRAESILTVSSFGCIDGMNAEYRELSQKKARQKQRSVKGRLRKLAQKANIRE